MCRWITVLSSENISLSDVVLAPQNSLLQLSRDASFRPGFSNENNHVTNGDGFGIGWYHSNLARVPRFPFLSRNDIEGHENMYAATFRDIKPAWNNHNLREICVATRSHCIMAHVRAASPFASVSADNCHPFKAGRLLFCHNGRVGNFPRIRRALLARLTDKSFSRIKGTTDSEALFGLIVTYLQEDGKNTNETPHSQQAPFGHLRLVQAIKKTLKYVGKLLEEAGDADNFSTLNFALSDGESMVVTRFCDKSPQVLPPSLYFAYAQVDELTGEMTSVDPKKFVSDLANKADGEIDGSALEEEANPTDTSATTDEEEPTYDELPIHLLLRESLPGLHYQDVDPSTAAFVVASCPLTKTHTWNPMPRNSIMWCSRGQIPELRLLRDKKPKSKMMSDHTIVMDSVKIGPVVLPEANKIILDPARSVDGANPRPIVLPEASVAEAVQFYLPEASVAAAVQF